MVAIASHGMSGYESHSLEAETQLLGRGSSKGGCISFVHHMVNLGGGKPIAFLVCFGRIDERSQT